MYQFSLDWYKELFSKSITDSASDNIGSGQGGKERVDAINTHHTKFVYTTVCRSLFERHKLLLSMQMCIKIQMANENEEERPNNDEWNFFLKGGEVMDRSQQPPKPQGNNADWITMQMWDNLTELEKVSETFKGIPQAVTMQAKDWARWFNQEKPEVTPLPGEWQTKCDDPLRAMIVVRCLRQDRVIPCMRNYIERYMKKDFIESIPFILKHIFDETTFDKPIIFVLSPGVDPTDSLKKLAMESEIQFEANSMGKGQSDKAKRIIHSGAEEGKWIFLANCHLSISLLPELE
jgi:dynein heavy chain